MDITQYNPTFTQHYSGPCGPEETLGLKPMPDNAKTWVTLEFLAPATLTDGMGRYDGILVEADIWHYRAVLKDARLEAVDAGLAGGEVWCKYVVTSEKFSLLVE